jgi:hypothetical protein
LALVSPASGDFRVLEAFLGPGTFSADGKAVYQFHRLEGTEWAIEEIGVETLRARRVSTFTLPEGTTATSVSLHPDGKRAAMSVTRTATDIVLLEARPARRGRLRRAAR